MHSPLGHPCPLTTRLLTHAHTNALRACGVFRRVFIPATICIVFWRARNASAPTAPTPPSLRRVSLLLFFAPPGGCRGAAHSAFALPPSKCTAASRRRSSRLRGAAAALAARSAATRRRHEVRRALADHAAVLRHDTPHTACACVPFAAQPFAADDARAVAPQAPLLARVADAEMSSLLPPGRALLPLPALGRRSTRRRRLLSFLFILLFFYAAQHILRRRSQYVLHRPEKRARKEAGRDGPQGPPARAPEECLVFIQVVLILVGQTRITTKT